MPDIKATTEPKHPAATTLKDKAPPKPRRLSSIPPALVVAATASRIPPAPRPPTRAKHHTEGAPTSQRSMSSRGPSSRPRNSRPGSRLEPARTSTTPPQTWELDEGRGNTLRGVAAATPPPTPQRDGAIALVGVSLAAAFLGGWWFLREPAPATPSSQVKAAVTEQAAPEARSINTAPVPKAANTRSGKPENVAEPALVEAQPEPRRLDSNAAAISVPARPNDTDKQPSVNDLAAPSPVPVQAPQDAAVEGDTALAGDVATEALAPPPAALPGFDADAAKRALGASSFNASSCRKGDDPRGTAEVIVTFAPSGRVTSANVNGAPFGGTATGGCIAATLRSATVPPFSGNHVTVRKLVTVR